MTSLNAISLSLLYILSYYITEYIICKSFIHSYETHLSFVWFLSFQDCKEIDYFLEDVAFAGIARSNVGLFFLSTEYVNRPPTYLMVLARYLGRFHLKRRWERDICPAEAEHSHFPRQPYIYSTAILYLPSAPAAKMYLESHMVSSHSGTHRVLHPDPDPHIRNSRSS